MVLKLIWTNALAVINACTTAPCSATMSAIENALTAEHVQRFVLLKQFLSAKNELFYTFLAILSIINLFTTRGGSS